MPDVPQQADPSGEPAQRDGNHPGRNQHYRDRSDINAEEVEFDEPHAAPPAAKQMLRQLSTSPSCDRSTFSLGRCDQLPALPWPTILRGSTISSNRFASMKPDFSAASFKVRSSSFARCAIFDALS